MQYAGVKCERSEQLGRPYVSRQECDECVQDPAHPCPFNAKMLKTMWGDDDNEPPALSLSPTRVLGCLRAKYFERADYQKILNPRKKWHAIRGSIAHKFFEEAGLSPGVLWELAEKRMTVELPTRYGPQKFSGKPDLIECLMEDGDQIWVKLTDWKSKRDIGHDFVAVSADHEKQVNMYSFLLQECLPGILKRPTLSVNVVELEIVYLTMNKVRRFTSAAALKDQGKLLRPYSAEQHEEIELIPVSLRSHEEMRERIIAWIEDTIEAQTKLYPPLEGEAARICSYCPFYSECGKLWKEQGI